MSSIELLAPSQELVAGESVQVPVVLKIDQPTKARGFHASFHGAEETKATYTTYNAATKTTQTQTAVEHHDIVRFDQVLMGSAKKGVIGNMADGLATVFGGGDHEVIEPGEYPFEVEVKIPSDARPTLTGKKCRVFYELTAQLDIPMGRDIKAKQAFDVVATSESANQIDGPVRTRYPEDHDRGLFDAMLVPDLRVEAALAEGNLKIGETIEGIFVVDSAKPIRYRSIRVRCIAKEQTSAKGHEDSFTHTGDSVEVCGEGTVSGKTSQEFQLPVPTLDVKSAQGENFTIDYFVELHWDVPWAKDPRIRVPITVR